MKLALIVSMALLIAYCANAQNLITNTNHSALPPDFSKMSYGEMDAAIGSEANLIVAERTKKEGPEYIADLVHQLQYGNLTDEKRVLIIYFLGVLHASDTNSIEALIRFIDLKATIFDPKTDIQRWGLYPAEEALIKIGKPVVNPILDHLPNETNQLRRQLMCDVLRRVLHQ